MVGQGSGDTIADALMKARTAPFAGKRAEFESISLKFDTRTVGNPADSFSPDSRNMINGAYFTEKITVLSFVMNDVVGRFVFRHVPTLPNSEMIINSKSIQDVELKLGAPHWSHNGIKSWGFFVYDGPGRYRFEFYRISVDEEDTTIVGVRYGSARLELSRE
jgi:hypothetical protein